MFVQAEMLAKGIDVTSNSRYFQISAATEYQVNNPVDFGGYEQAVF